MGAFTNPDANSWQQRSLLNEIEYAVYERQRTAGRDVAVGYTEAGQNAQSAAHWAERVNRINAVVNQNPGVFVVGTDARADLHNVSALPTYTTAGQLWQRVSGNAAGPRRFPATGTATYGLPQAGDRITLTLIQQMQQALRELKYTRVACTRQAMVHLTTLNSNPSVTRVTGTANGLMWDPALYYGNAAANHNAQLGGYGYTEFPPLPTGVSLWRHHWFTMTAPDVGNWVYTVQSDLWTHLLDYVVPTAALSHKAHVFGVYGPLTSPSVYYSIGAGGSVTSGRYGWCASDSGFVSQTTRVLDMRALLPRTFDPTCPLPGFNPGAVVEWGCYVANPLAVIEWGYSYA